MIIDQISPEVVYIKNPTNLIVPILFFVGQDDYSLSWVGVLHRLLSR